MNTPGDPGRLNLTAHIAATTQKVLAQVSKFERRNSLVTPLVAKKREIFEFRDPEV